MPLTIHQWNRQDNEAVTSAGWPTNVFSVTSEVLSPTDGESWKDLVRVEHTVVASAWFESGLPGGGWIFGGVTAMAGLKFSPTSETPAMSREDISPDVLGIYPLVPVISGNPGGSAPYSVTWTAQQPISVKTQRKLTPGVVGLVTSFMWLDLGDVGLGNFSWKSNLAALWAR